MITLTITERHVLDLATPGLKKHGRFGEIHIHTDEGSVLMAMIDECDDGRSIEEIAMEKIQKALHPPMHRYPTQPERLFFARDRGGLI